MNATLFDLPAPVTVAQKAPPAKTVYAHTVSAETPPAPAGQAMMDTLTDLTIMDMRLAVAVGAATVEELQAALDIVAPDVIGRRGVLEYAIKKRGGKLGIEREVTA